jgi:hypothetical protein
MKEASALDAKGRSPQPISARAATEAAAGHGTWGTGHGLAHGMIDDGSDGDDDDESLPDAGSQAVDAFVS